MSIDTETAKEIYIVGLRNQHAVESEAIELLERQVGRLENYPLMAERIRLHAEESREQRTRLEELLGTLSTSHSGLKDAAMSVMGNLMAFAHAPAPDEVLKNTLVNFAFENFEIASYRSLIELATLSGHTAAQSALTLSLREEEAMAAWVAENINPTIHTFVARRASGETAGR